MIRLALVTAVALLLAACLLLSEPLRPVRPVRAACEPEPITLNTPTGIAGCEVWGEGVASMYGPGDGVAMNFCTWALRTSAGCGSVKVTSLDTGSVVVAPVVDFCDCFTGTADERIVDLQYGVVAALGLDPARGLWPVRVERDGIGSVAAPQRSHQPVLPDTAMRKTVLLLFGIYFFGAMLVALYALSYVARRRRR